MDISHLFEKGYRDMQEKLKTSMNETTGDSSWFIEDDPTDNRVWQMKDRKIYGGSTKLGTSFLGRRMTPNKEFQFVSSTITVTEILFFYHEFGTATVRIVIDFQSNEDGITYQEFEDRTRSRVIVNRLMQFVNTFIKIDCQVLTDKMEEFNIPLAIDSVYFRELISSETIQVSYRKALWEHLVYEVEIDTDEPLTKELIEPYRALINSSQPEGANESSLEDDVHLYPGFGTSLIVTNKNSDPDDTNLIRTVEISEYYYAATSLLDDLLYDKFITFSLHRVRTTKIAEIQQDMEEIQSLSNLLEVFLFVLKDSVINLNAHAKIMWKAYEKEWYYAPMLETLEEKSKILNTKYENLLNELNEKRNQTLNRFVKIFTVFAIIGPLIEIYQVVMENQIIDKILAVDTNYLIIAIILIFGIVLALGSYIISQLRKFY